MYVNVDEGKIELNISNAHNETADSDAFINLIFFLLERRAHCHMYYSVGNKNRNMPRQQLCDDGASKPDKFRVNLLAFFSRNHDQLFQFVQAVNL
jgi:hypothetical protein